MIYLPGPLMAADEMLVHQIADTFATVSQADPSWTRQVHQLCDLLVHVEDPVGGGSGLGNIETLAVGPFPQLCLTEANSFL
jgi:hypothetical protein